MQNPQQNISKQDPEICEKDHTPWSSGIYSWDKGRYNICKSINVIYCISKICMRPARRPDLGWWIYNTICRWCIIEFYPWNLYNFINQYHPNKLNLKNEQKQAKRHLLFSTGFFFFPMNWYLMKYYNKRLQQKRFGVYKRIISSAFLSASIWLIPSLLYREKCLSCCCCSLRERNLEIFENAHLFRLCAAFSVLIAPTGNEWQDILFERVDLAWFPSHFPFALPRLLSHHWPAGYWPGFMILQEGYDSV